MVALLVRLFPCLGIKSGGNDTQCRSNGPNSNEEGLGQRGCSVNGREEGKPQESLEGMGGLAPGREMGGGGYLSIATPGTISQSPLS